MNLRMTTTTTMTTKLRRTQVVRVKKVVKVLNLKKPKKARNLNTIAVMTPGVRELPAKAKAKAKVTVMTKATDTGIADITGITTEDEAGVGDTEAEAADTTAGGVTTMDTEDTVRTCIRAGTRGRPSGRWFTGGLTKKSPISSTRLSVSQYSILNKLKQARTDLFMNRTGRSDGSDICEGSIHPHKQPIHLTQKNTVYSIFGG